MAQDSKYETLGLTQMGRMNLEFYLKSEECRLYVASLNPAQQKRFLQAAETQSGHTLYDPLEDDPIFGPLIRAAGQEVAEQVQEEERQRNEELEKKFPELAGTHRSRMGQCHLIWARLQILLRERYGIDWMSLQEMNPRCQFD